jgi:sec-independent protein translocase protein TatA
MGAMSLTHWLIVGVVLLMVFGPKRLGDVGAGLGEGIRNFKKGLNGTHEDEEPKQLATGKSSKQQQS